MQAQIDALQAMADYVREQCAQHVAAFIDARAATSEIERCVMIDTEIAFANERATIADMLVTRMSRGLS